MGMRGEGKGGKGMGGKGTGGSVVESKHSLK